MASGEAGSSFQGGGVPCESSVPRLRVHGTELQVVLSGRLPPQDPSPCPSGFRILQQKDKMVPAGTCGRKQGNPCTDLALLPSDFTGNLEPRSLERRLAVPGRLAEGELGRVSYQSVQELCRVTTMPPVHLQRRGFPQPHCHSRRQASPLYQGHGLQ